MPVRDGEGFLGAAIASVLSQSHEDLRLFVVDDGSEDASRAIAETFRARDQRVSVLQNEGGGIVAALETGIAAGMAPLIARMDADDVSLPRRLELQSSCLAQHPDTALVGGAVDVIDGEGKILRRMTYPTTPGELERRILTEVCFASATMLFRRSAFEEISGFRSLYEPAEDVDLALRIAEQYAVENLEDVVVCYRVHASNISVSRLKRQMQAVLVARAESSFRRRTGESPSMQSLDELQRELDVAEESIDDQSFEAMLAWGELLAEAGLVEESEALLREANVAGLGRRGADDIARIETTRQRARASRAARSTASVPSSGERRLPVTLRAAITSVRRRAVGTRKAVRAASLVSQGLLVLRHEGPNAFAQRVKGWAAARRLSKTPLPNVVLVDTSANDGLRARLPRGVREPEVSIVVVVWNALSYAESCLESIIRAESDRSFEVIVVDNGSDSDVLVWLELQAELHPQVGYVRLPSNIGFARGANIGVRASTGQYVVLLNSDTLVTDGWLDRLISALKEDQDLGLVSPVTNYVGEGDQIDEDALDLHPAAIGDYAESIAGRDGVIRVPERVAFFCVATPRHVLDRLNGLDEGFGLGNFEDEDFCVRLQMLGYRIGVVTNAFVFHHGSKTFEENSVDHSKWMMRNLDRYIGKVERMCTRFPTVRRLEAANGQPIVSVVVRTRNRPGDLRLALNSLMWQTFRQFEVVVVNDGGDDVEELLRPYAKDMNLRCVVNQPSHGRAEATNDGVDAATGHYVAFLDDDDIVYPFHLASLVHEAKRIGYEDGFVYSHYNRALVRGRGETATVIERAHLPVWTFDRRDLLVGNRPAIHTWLLPRALFQAHDGFDSSFEILHDWDFLLRVTERTLLVGLPRETCEYRVYFDLDNSVTGGRRRILEEMQTVYERHSSESAMITVGRKLEIAGVESQIAMAEELDANVESGTLTRDDAARDYIAAVFGVGVRG